jgi:type 1 glutamine amidotransferase
MIYRVLFSAASLAAIVSLAASSQAAPAKKKLLVVTYAAGFVHTEGIAAGVPVVKEIGEKTGLYDIDLCRTREDVQKMLTPDYLKAYDGVVFLNTQGNIGIPDLKAFLDWIASGKAFIGMHAAADTDKTHDFNPPDPTFSNFLGGEFRTHHSQCEVEAINNDPKHPANKHLGPTWKMFDEIYLFQNNSRDKVHVLLSLDKHPMDGSPEQGQPGEYLLSWCKTYGKGRVFYTAFGHRADVWQNEAYQQHILGGIRWALGLAKGDSKPGNPAPK